MDVIVIVQRIEKTDDFFVRRFVQFREAFGDVADFRRDHIPAGRFQRFRNRVEIADLSQKPRALLTFGNFVRFERFDFLSASFNRVAFGIPVEIGVGGFHDAEMIEEKADTPGLAE